MLFMDYKGKGELGGCISMLSEIKLQVIVHTYIYALEEKYRPLEVEYQINTYSVSIHSFTRLCPRNISDVIICLCLPSPTYIYLPFTLPLDAFFYCHPKPQVSLSSCFLQLSLSL